MSEQHASAPRPQATPSELMARGFALFPLRPGTKVPAVPRDWEHAATTSPLRLRQLGSGPHANHGIACGPSDLVVLDLDVAKGEQARAEGATDGWRVLQELAAEHEGELPRTYTVQTPSGGRHLYFRPPVDGPAPRNTVRRLGPLIDTRGAGGYVVAPGSRVDGVEYRVIEDAPIVPLPDWISALLRPIEDRPVAGEPFSLSTALGPVRAQLGDAYARTALEREIQRVESARVGTRNDTLNRAAYSLGTLVGSGLLPQAEVEVELTRAARAAGLEPREIAGTLRSGLTAGMARPRRLVGVGASAAASGVHQISLGEAEPNRTLIPTDVPQPAEWPRVFGRHLQLSMAATAVHRELSGQQPDFELPTMPALSPQGQQVAPAGLAELLTDLDDAYEAAAHASGPIVGAERWQRLLALVDALRDLKDELSTDSGRLPGPILGLIRSLTSAAARRIAALAKEITAELSEDGLRHSPLWTGVRRMQRAAEAVADFGTPSSPITASRYAAGRGALHAQLSEMRRSLQSSGVRQAS
ncbi:MAG TPA: bifunctional DNA primase/polymerase [Actinospica sp.]|nr:bifunctional DNA primase/polymerase [Actinospica sp.]